MNAETVVTVDALKKRFESLQNCKSNIHGLEDRRHETNVNKRIIKRTPAFRRDINISRKIVDHSQAPLAVTNNVKQFSNSNSKSSNCNKISQTNSHYYKTDNFNQNISPDPISKDKANIFLADQKILIQSLKKKLQNNSVIVCKPKVPKKNIDHTLKATLPVGPPPKKPPRTFAHDKQIDIDLPFKCVMESNKKSKSDPKVMLDKLEKFLKTNSQTYGTEDEKTAKQECNSKKSSKKSNLLNLAQSLKSLESKNVYDNSSKIYHTDEHNYLTTKSYCKNDREHIYDEPIFLNPNSRLNINGVDNCHTLNGNERACDSDKSNLHYMVNSEYQLK